MTSLTASRNTFDGCNTRTQETTAALRREPHLRIVWYSLPTSWMSSESVRALVPRAFIYRVPFGLRMGSFSFFVSDKNETASIIGGICPWRFFGPLMSFATAGQIDEVRS